MSGRSGRAMLAVLILLTLAVGGVWSALLAYHGEDEIVNVHRRIIRTRIPARCVAVGGVNVRRILEEPVGPLLIGALPEPELAALQAVGLELRQLSTLTFGVTGAGPTRPPGVVVVVRGSFDRGRLSAALEERFPAQRRVAGLKLYAGADYALATVGEDELLVGSQELVEEAAVVSARQPREAAAERPFEELRRHIDEGAALWFAGPVPLDAALELPTPVDPPRYAALSVDFPGRIELAVAARMRSPSDAQRLAKQLELARRAAPLAQLLGSPDDPGMELALTILDELQVDTQGAVLRARISLDERFLERVAGYLSEVVRKAMVSGRGIVSAGR